MLVAIPFGAVIALQLGSLSRQIGAQSFTGAASVLAIVREASPIVSALLIAGAGGSAICADLGSRKIRDEIDAMEVLGISPIQRLVVPRVLACMLVSVAAERAGLGRRRGRRLLLQRRPAARHAGRLPASFSALAQLPDLYAGEVKAFIFGLIAAVVASYKGLNAGGGPKGVGDAVNQSVVITFMLLFFTNFVITTVYFQVVPPKGSLMATDLVAAARKARRSAAGSELTLDTSASSCRSTSAPSAGRRGRSAATRRRSSGCWPRSPSAAVRSRSSAARSASSRSCASSPAPRSACRATPR